MSRSRKTPADPKAAPRGPTHRVPRGDELVAARARAHADPAAARRGLEHDRVADRVRGRDRLVDGRPAARCPRASACRPRGRRRAPCASTRTARAAPASGRRTRCPPPRPRARTPRSRTGSRSRGGSRPRPGASAASRIRSGRRYDCGGGRGAEADRLVGQVHVRRARVGVGVDGDRAQAQLLGGAQDPDGDLAAVGDEEGVEGHRPRGAARRSDTDHPDRRRVEAVARVVDLRAVAHDHQDVALGAQGDARGRVRRCRRRCRARRPGRPARSCTS